MSSLHLDLFAVLHNMILGFSEGVGVGLAFMLYKFFKE